LISSPVPLKMVSRAPVRSLRATVMADACADEPTLVPLAKEKPERITSGKSE